MQIELCDKRNEQKFQNFVMMHPQSLVYHTVRYKELIKKHLQCNVEYYLLDNDGRVEAILTLMSKEGTLGTVVNSLPFFGSNGGILANDDNAYRAMITHYNRLIEKASFATFIENPFQINEQKPAFNLTSHRVCQVTDTTEMDLEYLDTIFTSKKRNDLRKAKRQNLDVDIDNGDGAKQFLIETHIENMLAIGAKNKSEQYFLDLFYIFQADEEYDIFVARKDGEFVAALLLLYHKSIVEYYVPVILSQYRSLQALSLIIYEAMKWNKYKGRTTWNWGGNGTSLDSVYRFKRSWGASDIPYNYYIKTDGKTLPSLNPNKFSSDYSGFYLYPFEQRPEAA
jgi:hypothetical protein